MSPRSRNLDYEVTVTKGALEIANMLRERNLKATFFISLSPKDVSVDIDDYLKEIERLIYLLKPFSNIDIQPHLHALNLPVSFSCPSDNFSDYSHEQQVELLKWAKYYFKKQGLEAVGFRPGGYKSGDSYYRALFEAGYSYSSQTLEGNEADINLINNSVRKLEHRFNFDNITEHRVTTVLVDSVKPGIIEKINLSPDFFKLESVLPMFDKLDSLNVNFHSFSMYSNRMARENHQGQLKNNLIYYFIQKPLIRVASALKINTYFKQTLFRNELEAWLNEFQKEHYKTHWYREVDFMEK